LSVVNRRNPRDVLIVIVALILGGWAVLAIVGVKVLGLGS
jgi:hypothetical protein